MSVVATWTVLDPDSTAAGGELTVRTPADVTRLVDELAKLSATAAMIRHEHRPAISDPNLADYDADTGITMHEFEAALVRFLEPRPDRTTSNGNRRTDRLIEPRPGRTPQVNRCARWR